MLKVHKLLALTIEDHDIPQARASNRVVLGPILLGKGYVNVGSNSLNVEAQSPSGSDRRTTTPAELLPV